ncbi:hypothetical protein [Paraburkholderia sp. BR10882]|uniref:hypothetical protein n=1 Tax=unclassified Paraburkholderia TaxID=2615204 RepID=UPI0034CDEC4C
MSNVNAPSAAERIAAQEHRGAPSMAYLFLLAGLSRYGGFAAPSERWYNADRLLDELMNYALMCGFPRTGRLRALLRDEVQTAAENGEPVTFSREAIRLADAALANCPPWAIHAALASASRLLQCGEPS